MKVGISLPVREMAEDLGAIREFAQAAEELGLTHLRVPDQVIRPNNKHLHEPMTLLSYIAAITEKIELVPSIIVLPVRQTAMIARQAAELDVLSGGRLRLGIDTIVDNGINPLPVQRPIPIWVGAASVPGDAVVRRIGKWASGWFVLATPEEYPALRARIDAAAVGAVSAVGQASGHPLQGAGRRGV